MPLQHEEKYTKDHLHIWNLMTWTQQLESRECLTELFSVDAVQLSFPWDVLY